MVELLGVESDPDHVRPRAMADVELTQLHQTADPLGRVVDREVRDLDGNLIEDLSRPVESYGFAPGTRLFLTLKVGAGGGGHAR